jgi:hypothetical protein
MVQNTFTFQHDAPKVAKALGVNSNTEDMCLEIIIFSTVSNYLISKDLFDDRDSAPSKLTTMSGDLETALSLVRNEQEKDYMLFTFRQLHETVLASIAKNEVLNEMTGVERKKADLIIQMLEIKLEEKVEGIDRSSILTPSAVMNRIKLVGESRYNFEKYLLLLQGNNVINEPEN